MIGEGFRDSQLALHQVMSVPLNPKLPNPKGPSPKPPNSQSQGREKYASSIFRVWGVECLHQFNFGSQDLCPKPSQTNRPEPQNPSNKRGGRTPIPCWVPCPSTPNRHIKAAHPSGRERFGAGAGCSAIKYQSSGFGGWKAYANSMLGSVSARTHRFAEPVSHPTQFSSSC